MLQINSVLVSVTKEKALPNKIAEEFEDILPIFEMDDR